MVYKPPAPPLPPRFGKMIDRADLLPVLPTAKGGFDDAYTAVPRIDMPKKQTVPLEGIPKLKVAKPETGGAGGLFGLAIDVLDFGRTGVVSTLKEGIDLIQGEGFDFGDWKRQIGEHYGFGDLIHDERTAVGIGLMMLGPYTAALGGAVLADNIWVDRAVGMVGDFAVDPLMWLGGMSVFTRGLGWKGAVGTAGKTGMTDTLMSLQQKGGWEQLVPKLFPIAEKQGVKLSKEGVEGALKSGIVAAEKGRTASAVSRSLRQSDMGKVMSEYYGLSAGLRVRAPMTGPAGRMLRKDRWVEKAGKLLTKDADWFAKQQFKQIPPAYKAQWDKTEDLVQAISLARKSGKGISRRKAGARGRAKSLKEEFAHVPNVDEFVQVALKAARQPLEAFAVPSFLRNAAVGGAVMGRLTDLPVAVARRATPDPVKARLGTMFSRNPEALNNMLKSNDPYRIALGANFLDNLRYAIGREDAFDKTFEGAIKQVYDLRDQYKLLDEDITDFLDTMMRQKKMVSEGQDFGPEGYQSSKQFWEGDYTDRILREESVFWEKLPQSIKDLPADQYENLHKALDDWVATINRHTGFAYADEDGIWKAALEVASNERMPYRAPRRMNNNAVRRLVDPKLHGKNVDIDSYAASVGGDFKVGGHKEPLPFESHGYQTPASLKRRGRKVGQPVQIYADAGEAAQNSVGKTKINKKDVDVLLEPDGSVFLLKDPNEVGLSFRRQIDEAYERAFGERAFEGRFKPLMDAYKTGMKRDIRMTHFMKRIREYYPVAKFEDIADEMESGIAAWEKAASKRTKKLSSKVSTDKKIIKARGVVANLKTNMKVRQEKIDDLSLKAQAQWDEVEQIGMRALLKNEEVSEISSRLEAMGADVERLLKAATDDSMDEWLAMRDQVISEAQAMSSHADAIEGMLPTMDELYTQLVSAVKKEIGTPLPTSREGFEAVVDELETVQKQFDALTKERDQLVERIEVIEKEFDRNVEEIRVLSEQRATREEALPLLREQAESVKPKRTVEDVKDVPAVRESSDAEIKTRRRIEMIDEELAQLNEKLKVAKKAGAVSERRWQRIQDMGVKYKAVKTFKERLILARDAKRAELDKVREELAALKKEKKIEFQVDDPKKGTISDFPPPAANNYEKRWAAREKGAAGKRVTTETVTAPAGLDNAEKQLWDSATSEIKELNKQIKSLEEALKTSESLGGKDRLRDSTLGFKTRWSNKSKKMAELNKQKNRGPFTEGGKAEKQRLAKIAALEIDLENNYKNIVNVKKTRDELKSLGTQRTKFMDSKRELIKKSERGLAREARPWPEVDIPIEKRTLQRVSTLRKKIQSLKKYEDDDYYGDLAFPVKRGASKKELDKAIAKTRKAVETADEYTRLVKEITFYEQELTIGKTTTYRRETAEEIAENFGQGVEGESRPSLAAVKASFEERLKLLSSEKVEQIKKELLRGPRIEVVTDTGAISGLKDQPVPKFSTQTYGGNIPSNTQLFAESPDGRWGLISVPKQRSKEVVEGIPFKNEVLVRVQKVSGNRWKVSGEIYEKDFLREYINLTPNARQEFKDQGWFFYDEGLDADTRALELTKVEQDFDDAEFLLNIAKDELGEAQAVRKEFTEGVKSSKVIATDIFSWFDERIKGGIRTKGRYARNRTPDQTYKATVRRNARQQFEAKKRALDVNSESYAADLKKLETQLAADLKRAETAKAPITNWLEEPRMYGDVDPQDLSASQIEEISLNQPWIRKIMKYLSEGGEPHPMFPEVNNPQALYDVYSNANVRTSTVYKQGDDVRQRGRKATDVSDPDDMNAVTLRGVENAQQAKDDAQRVFDKAQQNLEKFGVSRKGLRGKTHADMRILPVTPKKSVLAKTGRPEGDQFTTNLRNRVTAAESDARIMDKLRQERIVETGKLGRERADLRRMISEMEAEMAPVKSRTVQNIDQLEGQFQMEIDSIRTTVEAIREYIKIITTTAKQLDMQTPAVQSMQLLKKFLGNIEKGIVGTEGLTAPARMRDWMERVAEFTELNKIFNHESFTAGARNTKENLTFGQNLRLKEQEWSAFKAKTRSLEEEFGIMGQEKMEGLFPFRDLGPTIDEIRDLKGLITERIDLEVRQQEVFADWQKMINYNKFKKEPKNLSYYESVQANKAAEMDNKLEEILTLQQVILSERMKDLNAAVDEWTDVVGQGKRLEKKTERIIEDLASKSERLGASREGAVLPLRAGEKAPFEDTFRAAVKDLGDSNWKGSSLSNAQKATQQERLNSMKVIKDSLSASQWGPWTLMNSDQAMNRDVAAVINAFARINDPVESAWMWQKWDKFQGWLKAGMIATPGFVERNIFGAYFNAWLDGVDLNEIAAMGKKVSTIANKSMRDNTSFYDAARAMSKSDHPDADLYEDIVSMLDVGVRGGGQAISSVELEYGLRNARSLDIIFGGKKGKRTFRTKPVSFWSPQWTPFAAVRTLNSWAEDIIRLGIGADTLKAGGTVDDALNRIAKTQFDYDELTKWERTWARRFIPFYTWTRKNLPYQLEKFWTQPAKYNRLMSVKRNLEMGTEGENVVPDYYMEPFGMRLPFKYKGAVVYTAPDFPFQDLFRYDPMKGGGPISGLGNITKNILSSTSPIVKTPLEVGFGKQIFTGIPFTGRYQQAPNPITKIEPLMYVLDELGMAEKSPTGWKMRDHYIYLVNGVLPTVNLLRRMFPNERKYQRTHIRNLISFAGGVNVNFNTPEVQYDWLQGQKWEELSDRQDQKDLLFRVK